MKKERNSLMKSIPLGMAQDDISALVWVPLSSGIVKVGHLSQSDGQYAIGFKVISELLRATSLRELIPLILPCYVIIGKFSI